MLRRNIIVDVLMLLVAVLAGLLLSNNDQTEYSELLSHGGMSEQAYVYKSHSGARMSTAVAKLNANDKLQNYQVQFAASKNITYLFAKGNYTSVPLLSGHMMGADDYQSSLPVAVVGQNVANKAYNTSTQRYYRYHNKYIPIVGVVGTRLQNQLNDRVFFSASSSRTTTMNPQLKDVEIMVDGADAQHTRMFGKVFGDTHPRRILYATAHHHSGWWTRNWRTLLGLIGLIIGAAAVGLLTAGITPRPQTSGLNGLLRNNYLRGLTVSYLPGVGIAMVIGTIFSWLRFYITDHFRLLLIVVLLMLVYWFSAYLFIHQRSRKEDQRAITQ
ncbi:hypothetical protein PQ472_06065 [Lacticaseibacillus pabuli]|uniref:MacB-like protein n=1 Tax=Lacticaseibacillus pabuli TaxID=3025672 RepID=A0ABY7WQ70_9LACO|nr:hypothetical protein [Lacticaseibacillus sp. KACC 23028]WDF81503.1 hypothetical protein PQ472_06065 [Lacticaseibacillus sp. KACC 23028]